MNGNWLLSAITPQWVTEVSRQLDEAGIEYTTIDKIVGIFNCQSKVGGRSYRYYASGGVIVGSNLRGIQNLVKLLTEGEYRREEKQSCYGGYNNRSNTTRYAPTVPYFREIRNGTWGSYLERNNGAYAYA